MSTIRTAEILQQFAKWKDKIVKNINTDISDITPLLEEYLIEAGLRQLTEDEDQFSKFPNFSEAAFVLELSVCIYGLHVDSLLKLVQNAVAGRDKPSNRDASNEDKISRRSKRLVELSEFKHIDLDEASNIDIKETHEPKPITMLPKAFIQFEPRIMAENDIKLKDYNGETIGLMSDFRVNWNTDENFMLCDDMDFCTSNNSSEIPIDSAVPNSMVSPSDSGHTSDCYVDFAMDSTEVTALPDCSTLPMSTMKSIIGVSDNTLIVNNYEDDGVTQAAPNIIVTPTTVSTATNNQVVGKVKKRKLPFATPVPPKMAKKFTISSPLSGTVKHAQLTPCEFSLPFLDKFIEQRLCDKKNIKQLLVDLYSGTDMDANFLMNDISPMFKKRPPMTWSRKEIYKKLKLSEFNSDELDADKGFYDDDDNEKELSDNLEALEKVCLRLEGLPIDDNEDTDKLSECTNADCADIDDVPDDSYNNNNTFEPSIAGRLEGTESNLTSFSFAEQSDISKRVEAWHMSIQEKLKLIENRKKFDIEEYSTDVINSFKAEDKAVVNFSDVMKGHSPGETARYFLTTLMLANKSQVVIKPPEPLSCGDFQISLGKIDGTKKLSEDIFF